MVRDLLGIKVIVKYFESVIHTYERSVNSWDQCYITCCLMVFKSSISSMLLDDKAKHSMKLGVCGQSFIALAPMGACVANVFMFKILSFKKS